MRLSPDKSNNALRYGRAGSQGQAVTEASRRLGPHRPNNALRHEEARTKKQAVKEATREYQISRASTNPSMPYGMKSMKLKASRKGRV